MRILYTFICASLIFLISGKPGQTQPDPFPAIIVQNAAAVVQLASLPVTGLARIAWSPAGDKLAVADASHLRIYNLQDFSLDVDVPSYGDALDLVFSPDGRSLAFAFMEPTTHNGVVGLYRFDPSEVMYRIALEAVSALAFSSDSRLLAYVNDDGYINLYNVEDRTLNRILPFKADDATGLAFGPSDQELGIGRVNGDVQMWNLATNRDAGILHVEYSSEGGGNGFPWLPRTSVAYQPDGHYLVSGSTWTIHPLWLWNRETRQASAVLQRLWSDRQGNSSFLPFNSAAFSSDGKLLVTAMGDPQSLITEVDLWDVEAALTQGTLMRADFPYGTLVTRHPLATLWQPGASTGVLNPDSTLLATAGTHDVRLWGSPEHLQAWAAAQKNSDITVLAYCQRTGESVPTVHPNQTVTLFWSWFANDLQQIQNHLDNVIYTLTLDGQPLNTWQFLTQVTQDPINNNHWTVYWYTALGKLSVGAHTVEYQASWRQPITDGDQSYGPGTGHETERGRCSFSVKE